MILFFFFINKQILFGRRSGIVSNITASDFLTRIFMFVLFEEKDLFFLLFIFQIFMFFWVDNFFSFGFRKKKLVVGKKYFLWFSYMWRCCSDLQKDGPFNWPLFAGRDYLVNVWWWSSVIYKTIINCYLNNTQDFKNFKHSSDQFPC